LAPQPSVGLGLLHKIRVNFLEVSQQFSFLQGRVVSPTPNLHPGGPGLSVFISLRGRVATHFSRLLRHSWITVGLFLFPGHHTGIYFLITIFNPSSHRSVQTGSGVHIAPSAVPGSSSIEG
jgi:hypothetical protein